MAGEDGVFAQLLHFLYKYYSDNDIYESEVLGEVLQSAGLALADHVLLLDHLTDQVFPRVTADKRQFGQLEVIAQLGLLHFIPHIVKTIVQQVAQVFVGLLVFEVVIKENADAFQNGEEVYEVQNLEHHVIVVLLILLDPLLPALQTQDVEETLQHLPRLRHCHVTVLGEFG